MDALNLVYGRVDPRDPAMADLIARHAAHSAAHYPSESNHHLDASGMASDGVVLFAGGRDGVFLAMGGYKVIWPKAGEVKSMHVTETARGHGAAGRILELILDHARRAGVERMFLETGRRQASAAARRLYERAGFVYCPPFGSYREDDESVFMVRDL